MAMGLRLLPAIAPWPASKRLRLNFRTCPRRLRSCVERIPTRLHRQRLRRAPPAAGLHCLEILMHDSGLPLPTQASSGRARCFCGASIDIAITDQHVCEAHMDAQRMKLSTAPIPILRRPRASWKSPTLRKPCKTSWRLLCQARQEQESLSPIVVPRLQAAIAPEQVKRSATERVEHCPDQRGLLPA